MTSPVASEETVGPIGIIRRSWELTRGNWWRLFGFIVLFLLGQRVSALGSELLGSTAISLEIGAILLVLPLFGVLLAMLVARLTILRALGRML